jgi:hypothetical protein
MIHSLWNSIGQRQAGILLMGISLLAYGVVGVAGRATPSIIAGILVLATLGGFLFVRPMNQPE